jgi:peptide/nickel transport system substrate-binding protein
VQRAAALGIALPAAAALSDLPAAAAALPRAQASPTPKSGGTLTALMVDDPKTLDIQVSQLGQLRQMIESIYDALTYIDARDMQAKPRLGTAFTWVDPTTLEVTLRSGVTFHEGQPLTADDVKFTIERILNPATASPVASYLGPLQGAEAVDATHVRFHLKTPWPALVSGLSTAYIYSKTATDESITTKPNGTGPFSFVEWKPTDHVTLKRNPNYWWDGRPYLDELVFRPIKDQATRLSAMQAGSADVMFSLEFKDVARAESITSLVVAKNPINDTGHILYLNNNRAPMSNQQLRLALSYAFDRDTFHKQFLGGNGQRNTSPWYKQHWAYNPINDTAFPYDLDKAKQLLSDGGYPGGKGADGKQLQLDIVVPTGYAELMQGSVMLQAALKQLGVGSKIEEVEISVWIDRIVTHDDYDVSWDYHSLRAADPAFTLSQAFFYPPGPQNITRYKDDQLAALIQQGGTSTDQATRKQAYYQFQARWNELMPGIIIGEFVLSHALQSYVEGFVTHPDFFQDFREVWLNK